VASNDWVRWRRALVGRYASRGGGARGPAQEGEGAGEEKEEMGRTQMNSWKFSFLFLIIHKFSKDSIWFDQKRSFPSSKNLK
jgi:hypothetical protein